MRPIKFRAWDEKKRLMFYFQEHGESFVEILNIYGDGGWTFGNTEFGEMEEYTSNSEGTLMQFTGLLDKNGKEIYEGDVMKDAWSNEVGEVAFNDGAFDPGFGYRENWALQMQSGEVIGNIYENPELLTKSK